MKRSVLLGLFVTASMMASTSFAAGAPESLCDTNLQTINNAKAQTQQSPEINARVEASVQQAKAYKAAGDIEKCIAETDKTIQDLRKTTDGTNK